MPKTAVAAASPDESNHGVATILGRRIKMKKLEPGQLLVVDMMARRLQRIVTEKGEDGKFQPEAWEKFLSGTRRLLDWISDQFVEFEDLEWFEQQMLLKNLSLDDIGPLLTAMGLDESKQEPDNRKARRATKATKATGAKS